MTVYYESNVLSYQKERYLIDNIRIRRPEKIFVSKTQKTDYTFIKGLDALNPNPASIALGLLFLEIS